MDLKYLCCVIIEKISFCLLSSKCNKLPIFDANRNVPCKCSQFYRIYGTSTVPNYWYTGYQLKSLDKSATDLHQCEK
jgi:hypothetical protein